MKMETGSPQPFLTLSVTKLAVAASGKSRWSRTQLTRANGPHLILITLSTRACGLLEKSRYEVLVLEIFRSVANYSLIEPRFL